MAPVAVSVLARFPARGGTRRLRRLAVTTDEGLPPSEIAAFHDGERLPPPRFPGRVAAPPCCPSPCAGSPPPALRVVGGPAGPCHRSGRRKGTGRRGGLGRGGRRLREG